ncbi:MAG: CPBP family intramembrane glutamic endopeptidase [Bacteroidota bacterium]|jgi:membrane protease YdiL (CAAX protease family)
MQGTDKTYQGILVFLTVTFFLSSIFYFFIISAGRIHSAGNLYVIGLMWCPGAAAILTCFLLKRNISSLGWRWGKTKYQLLSYFIPLAYTSLTYAIVWALGFGSFGDYHMFVEGVARRLGLEGVPSVLVIVLFVTVGMVIWSCSTAIGEEIGWRGFLVPALAKTTTFTKTALISGVIWSVWHYPIILFADYNNETPWWYGLPCFTVMTVGLSFIYTWLRLKSGSLWTGMFLHASHNLFIQGVFNPLTTHAGITEYIIGEFGIALAFTSLLFGYIFWRLRLQIAVETSSLSLSLS